MIASDYANVISSIRGQAMGRHGHVVQEISLYEETTDNLLTSSKLKMISITNMRDLCTVPYLIYQLPNVLTLAMNINVLGIGNDKGST